MFQMTILRRRIRLNREKRRAISPGGAGNPAKPLAFLGATVLATLLHKPASQKAEAGRPGAPGRMTLYSAAGGRKYLNAAERRRFLATLDHLPASERLFCLVLMWSGPRVSEARTLTPATFDLDSGTVTFRTLKQRVPGRMRQVPLPEPVLADLDRTFGLRNAQADPGRCHQRLWPWSRATAWRKVKVAMREAGVSGPHATAKGLRHTFGVAAFEARVPPHLIQRWLGHASLRTTAIYGEVSGPEERTFAARLWDEW